MTVDVRLPTVLRQHSGGLSVVQAQGSSIGEVLADLSKKFPSMSDQLLTENGELHKFVNVYINDDDVRYLDKLDTKVEDGDVISILPAVAGGDE